MRSVVPCAALLAASCVSSSTWRSIDDVERAIEEDRAAVEAVTSTSSAVVSQDGPVDCARLAELVVAVHPGLAAPRARARAAIATARAEGALPPPSIAAEVWDFPVGDPSRANREGMYMLHVAQTLPPGDMLDGSTRAAAEDALAALAELAEMRRQIRARARHACADRAAAQARRIALESSSALLGQMSELIAARQSTGAPIADLASIDAERARLDRLTADVNARASAAESVLRTLLGLGATDALAPTAPLSEPQTWEADALVTRAIESRGMLAVHRARALSAAARADSHAAAADVPTFDVRASYMQVPDARAGLGVFFGMTLPWLSSAEGSRRDAARAEAEAELADLAGLERDVATDVTTALGELARVSAVLATLRERERPALERALVAVQAGYASGSVDLLAWLDVVRRQRELSLDEIELLGAAEHAVAEVELAVGAPLATGREGGAR